MGIAFSSTLEPGETVLRRCGVVKINFVRPVRA